MRTSFKPDERRVRFFTFLAEAQNYLDELNLTQQHCFGADLEMITLADIENARRLRDELKPIADRLAGRG